MKYVLGCNSSARWWRSPQRFGLTLLLGILLLSSSGCRTAQNPPDRDSKAKPNPENRLIVADALLEQSDKDGKILWKLSAKEAIYSQDRKFATVTGVLANLYEGDQVILSLQAAGGTVINDGEKVILVTDNRIGAVLKAKKAEWQPANNLLLITEGLEGKYPNGKFTAQQAKYLIDQSKLELMGKVDGLTVKPAFRLQGEELTWQLEQEIITANKGLKLQQIETAKDQAGQSPAKPPQKPGDEPQGQEKAQSKEQVITQLVAKKLEVFLKKQEVVISEEVLLNHLKPSVQFASKTAVWNLEKNIVIGKQAVQITHRDQKVQFQANQGQFNLKTSQANLSGNVRGVGQKPPFKLNTNQLDWNLETQVLLAVGAVVYEQAEPRVTLTGDRATGQLKQNKLVVSGTKQKPVTTKVIP